MRTGGSDSAASGGFNPSNTNFPTDGTVDTNTGNTSAPVFSSASYNFVAGDVGAWLFVKSGTNTLPGWYQIASVASNKATLTASIGSAVRYSTVSHFTNTAVGIATTGTPSSITWGIDYSQQNSAQISFTDMVIDAGTNTNFTSAANPVGKNFVGNLIRVTGGTGFTVQWVEVVSTSGTTATCDKSLGTLGSTGGTGNLGGAFASLANFTSTTPELVAGYKIFIASGTYSHTAQIIIRTTCWLIGYDALRTTTPTTRPILRNSYAGELIGTDGASPYLCGFINLDLDGESSNTTVAATRVSGVSAFESYFDNCIVRRMTTYGVGSNTQIYNSVFHNNGTHGVSADGASSILFASVFRDNGTDGVGGNSSNGDITANHCIFARNGARGVSAYNMHLENCLFHSNTGTAIGSSLISGYNRSRYMRNLILWGNGGWGIQNGNSYIPGGASTSNAYVNTPVYNSAGFAYIAAGSNTSGNFQNLQNPPGFVALTADPCVDATNNDFSLNNTAGAGADCRAAGFPGAFPGGTTTGYLDIGAVQHQDAGGIDVPVVWKLQP